MKRIIFAAALLLVPASLMAQSATPTSWEFSPFIGYMGGGSVNVVGPDIIRHPDTPDVDINYRQRNVKIETGTTWGLRVDRSLSWGPNLQVEGMFVRTQSQLEDNQALFGEAPGGPVPVRCHPDPGTGAEVCSGDASFTDTSLTYLHGGVLWVLSNSTITPYDIRPYVVGTVGITEMRFHEIPLPDQTRPSISGGVGVKWGLTERLMLRIESRAYYTNMSKKSRTVPLNVRDCPDCLRTYTYPGSELQGDITFGLAWKL